MSLVTDKFFAAALAADTTITSIVADRIYNTVDDEISPEGAKLPNILIINNGSVNDEESKDDPFESEYDNDSIVIQVSAITREGLGQLASAVRECIHSAMQNEDDWESYGFEIEDYRFSASRISFDADNPCYWQDFNYECSTINL